MGAPAPSVSVLPPAPLRDEDCFSRCLVKYYNEAQTAQCPDGFSGDPITIPAGTLYSCVSLGDANQQAADLAQAQLQCNQVWWNTEQIVTCPENETGEPVIVPAHSFSSTVSQEDANQQAAELAQSQLQCQPEWKNVEQSAQCDVGYSGSAVTVPAGSFSSTISQSDADQQALAYAESQLVCELIPQTPIRQPAGFLYTSDERMFVVGGTPTGCAIYEVDRSGKHITVLSLDYDIYSLIEASDGNYYFTSRHGTIEKLTPSFVLTTLATGLSTCCGLCQGADGALYTSPQSAGGTSDQNIWRVTLAGEKSVYLNNPGPSNEFLYQDHPVILSASDSKLYFTNYEYANSSIYRINGPGAATESTPQGAARGNAMSFFESSDGLFYSASFMSGQVFSISKALTYSEIATIPVNTPYGTVYLYEGKNGILYVTTNNNPTARLFSVTKAGVVTLLHTWTNEGIYDIFGGVVGFGDDLFFGGWSANKVWRYSLSTGLVTAFA